MEFGPGILGPVSIASLIQLPPVPVVSVVPFLDSVSIVGRIPLPPVPVASVIQLPPFQLCWEVGLQYSDQLLPVFDCFGAAKSVDFPPTPVVSSTE